MASTMGIYENGAFIIIASRPAVGKTALALDIARHLAESSDKTVLFISLEASKEQTLARLETVGEKAYNNILIDDHPTRTVKDIEALCRNTEKLGAVIIDYFQLLAGAAPANHGQDRQAEGFAIAGELKEMALRLSVPVICTSHISRVCEYRENKRPKLSDLRISGVLEKCADQVLFLYRDAYYDWESPVGDMAECIIAQNKFGDTGTVLLRWDPERAYFSRWEE